MPEQILVRRRRPNLAGAQLKAQSPIHYRWDQQENPRALRLQSGADFSTSTKSHEDKAYFKEQTHLDAVPCALHIPTSKLTPQILQTICFQLVELPGHGDRHPTFASISSEIRND